MSLFFLWHIACSTLIALIFALIFGSLGTTSAAFALALGAVASYFISRADSASKKLFIDPKDRSTETLWLERVVAIVVFYISYRHFLYLLYEVNADLKTLNPNNFGDLPLHINYIRTISNGAKFPWVDPSYSLDLLRYPLGIDVYNALWEAIGVKLSGHLFLVGMICSWLIIRFTRILASWWGLVGLYFAGGFAGWWFFGGHSAFDLQGVLAWKNLFLAVIVTQRGFLFAIPAGLYLILRARRPEKLSWNFGLMWGLLAYFHIHTFVIVSLVLGGEALIRKDVRKFVRSLFIAVPIGTFAVLFSSNWFKSASILRWQWGWTNGSGNFLAYLNFNFGPYLYLLVGTTIYLAITLFDKKQPAQAKQTAKLYFLYLFLFCLFFNLILAPWDWDNIKILIWPYLLILGTWSTFNKRLSPTHGLQILIAVILGYSGFSAISPSLTSTAQALTIYNKGELAKTQSAISQTSSDSVFLAATTHNHPLTYFGKIRAVGYEGHLWSHGIDAHLEVEKLKKIFAGDPGWRDLAHDLKVTHIYWGKDEKQQFGDGDKPWKNLKNISNVEDISVYEVQ